MTKRKFRSVHIILAGAALFALPANAWAYQESRLGFDAPAQDLGDALRHVAAQAGIELYVAGEDIAGRTAPPLRGQFTSREAIETLLRGTGLMPRFDGNSVIIRREGQLIGTGGQDDTAIVVTGTRIEGAPPAAPVTVVTNEDIRNAGQADLGEVARGLPQNFGGGHNPGLGTSQGSENVNLNGASTFNLRGIGPNATLTLLNGNRFGQSGNSSALDISAIPVSAVERVEIVADGASAIYGADAIAGVVNILLRKDYEGVSTSARLGASTDGGNFQQQYNLLGGARWSGGGFMATYDFFSNGAIRASDRSYAAMNHPDNTLYPALRRHSLLLSGHQELGGGLQLSADLVYKRGNMGFQRGLTLDRPVNFRGIDTHTRFETIGIAPTLAAELGGAWTAKLSGFYGTDRTRILSTNFMNGAGQPTVRRYANRNLAIEAGVQGPLVAIPAGDVRVALGGGLRSNRLAVDLAGDIFTPSRENYFAYAELFVPLANPEQDIGFAHRAALTAALRWEDYSDSGSIVTPKLGLVYAPAEALSLGLSWGRSFKVATLFKQYNGYSAILFPSSDYGSLYPAGTSYLYLLGSDPDVGPERSENWTLSATIRPSPRLQLVASFFDINYKDRVAAPLSSYVGALTNPIYTDLVTSNPAAALLAELIAGADDGLQNGTPSPYDPTKVIALLDGRDRNIARQRYSGADLSLRYRIPMEGERSLTLTAAGSWLDSRQQLRPGLPSTDLAGLIFNPPHFRARAGVSYEDERFTLSSFLGYSGGVTDRRRPVPAKLAPFATIDVTAGIQLGDIAELSLAALNIFNKKPEVIRTTSPAEAPYDTTNHSPIGRFLGLTIRRDW
jgi:iron complex outermembrane receptor protein